MSRRTAARGRIAIALAAAVFAASGSVAATQWDAIRDGVVWIRSEEPVRIECTWRPAWSAEGHRETIYFQDPTGALLKRRRIDFSEASGREVFETGDLRGDYRLEICGYSYREYTVRVPDGAASVLEPVRLHCCLEGGRGDTFHFRVEAGTSFTLGGKFHGGSDRLEVSRRGVPLDSLYLLDPGKRFGYTWHDEMDLEEGQGAMWSVSLPRSGKLAFWLEGTPNYFALRAEDWFEPVRLPGSVRIQAGPVLAGAVPGIGAEVEFADLPQELYDALATMTMTSVNHYVFQDAIEKMPPDRANSDVRWLRVYENRMGIANALYIAEPDRRHSMGGVPTPAMLPTYGDFLLNYLAHRRGPAKVSVDYLAFFDEPNSRYPDYAAFEADFVALARAVRASKNPEVRGVRICAPESANFLHGPTKGDAEKRIGIRWAERLIEKHPDLVDAVSWHVWMVRDLIATEWFGQCVAEAASMVDRAAAPGSARRELIVGQTNLSSGPDISPYEQDTFFAALWWASAVAHASRSGRLRMIHWTPSLDDPRSAKGLITPVGRLKPVAHAMRFVNQAVAGRVLVARSDSPEVPVMVSWDASAARLCALFVNQAPRSQVVVIRFELPAEIPASSMTWRLQRLGEALRVETAGRGELSPTERAIEWRGEVDGPAIYALEMLAR